MSAIVAPRERLSDAGALVVKLVALAFMVADHVDWFLHDGALGFNATLGRAVFPLFAFLLAVNLSRSSDPVPVVRKLVPRLLIFGALAHPAYMLLQGHLLPLNIMFTLAAAVAIVACLARGWYVWAALALFWLGAFVDYAWLGLAAVVGPWLVLRAGFGFVPALVLACVLLSAWCGSAWPFAAVPVLLLAMCIHAPAPRWKWLFYAAYPAHLVALVAVLYLG